MQLNMSVITEHVPFTMLCQLLGARPYIYYNYCKSDVYNAYVARVFLTP